MSRRAIGFLCVAMLLAASPAGAEMVIEIFDVAGTCAVDAYCAGVVDTSAADTELIVPCSAWSWGAYYDPAGASEIDCWPDHAPSEWGGIAQFQAGIDPGVRLYTRFDNTTGGSGANTPSITVDATGVDAEVFIGMAQTFGEGNIAILIRDDGGWWQSSPVTIPDYTTAGWDLTRRQSILVSSLTWTQLDATNAGVIDMDEVDDAGERAIAYLGSGSPNLDLIEGVGIIALESVNGQWTVNNIGFDNVTVTGTCGTACDDPPEGEGPSVEPPPPPPVEPENIIETFDLSVDPGNFVNLDWPGPDTETVAPFSRWTWGGYASGPAADPWPNITQNTNWGGVVQFQWGARAGSYIYSRFDDHVIIDASTGGDIRVTIQMNFEAQDWAFLIRDNIGWWQSNAVTMPDLAGGWVWTEVDTAISSLTWSRVVSGAAADMDELDDLGEQAITLGAAGSPNLSNIIGLGLIAVTEGASQYTISEFGFVDVLPNYFVPATGLPGLIGLISAIAAAGSVGGVVLVRRRKR